MIEKIKFENYKLFREKQEMELRKLTIIIGKNSSGKSSITKLFPLLENSLSGKIAPPLLLNNFGIELGKSTRDLLYAQGVATALKLSIEDENESLSVIIGLESNDSGKPYIREWNGAEPEKAEIFKGFCKIVNGQKTPQFTLNTDYIGPFRVLPSRFYYSSNQRIDKIGKDGHQAYTFLLNDFEANEFDNTKGFIAKVNEWFKSNFEGWGIKIEHREPDYQIKYTKGDAISVNLTDVGQGIGQSLPLVIRAFMPVQEPTLIIVEQPELHLHPAAHGNLAELFATTAKNDPNKHYLIETHSDTFLLRLQLLVVNKIISPEDIIIHYVDFDETKNQSSLQKIEVDKLGRMSHWPKGIFGEAEDATLELIAARQQRKPNEL